MGSIFFFCLSIALLIVSHIQRVVGTEESGDVLEGWDSEVHGRKLRVEVQNKKGRILLIRQFTHFC